MIVKIFKAKFNYILYGKDNDSYLHNKYYHYFCIKTVQYILKNNDKVKNHCWLLYNWKGNNFD